MRRLIADIFKILYELTGYKFPSFIAALVYITALNMLTIYGLAILLSGAIPEVGFIFKLYTFPLYFLTAFGLLAFNYIIMLPLENLSKEKGSKIMPVPIIIYTVISIILFIFTIYNKYNPYNFYQ